MRAAVVFGGAGFIGHYLLAELSRTGEYGSLVSADIDDPRYPVPGVSYRRVDVREEIPRDLCPGVTEIYNLAAVHKTPGHKDWEYFWTNVMGATNVCRYATVNDVRFIGFTSSISVYGPCEEPKDENSALEPDSAYGRSKLAAERIHLLWQAQEPATRRLAIARPAAIYGRDEKGNFTRLARLLRRGVAIYPGRRDAVKACGYVEDLAASLVWARARTEPVLTYNFCRPERYTTEQVCAAFSKVAGYKPVELAIPFGLVSAGVFFFEIFDTVGFRNSINRARVLKLIRSTNVIPAQLQALKFPYRFTLEDGLARWKAASKISDFD